MEVHGTALEEIYTFPINLLGQFGLGLLGEGAYKNVQCTCTFDESW